MKLNLSQIVKKVSDLRLPKDSFVIFGSGPLAAHNLRQVNDIDLLVEEKVFQKLQKEGWREKQLKTGKTILVFKEYEVSTGVWIEGVFKKNLNELLSKATYAEQIPFANLVDVLDWKLAAGRDKDLHDIVLIEDFLKTK